MAWSFNSTLMTALRDGEVRPVYAARFNFPARAQLQVLDYSLASGATFTVTQNSVTSNTLTEGVDFSRGSSNEECATNLAGAINIGLRFPSISAGYRQNRARAIGDRVNVTPFRGAGSPSLGGTWSSAFQTVSPAPRAQWYWNTGKTPFAVNTPVFTTYLGLDNVNGVAWAIDPLTREAAVHEIELTFVDDGELRRINQDVGLRGQPFTLQVGAEGVDFTDFETVGTFYVADVRADGSNIILTCEDGLAAIRDLHISGSWQNMHPLEVIEDIVTTALGSGVGNYFNTTSLNHISYPNISHWSLSRWNESGIFDLANAIQEPEPILDVVNELLELLGGTLRPSQLGVLGWAEYDSTASAVANWTQDDITSIEVIETWDNTVNDCDVKFAQGYNNEGTATFQQGDGESQRELDRVYRLTVDTKWCNAVTRVGQRHVAGPSNGTLYAPGSNEFIILSDSTSFIIERCAVQGFAGSRWSEAGGVWSQTSGDDLNNTTPRRAYLRLEPGEEQARYELPGSGGDNTTPEIIACYQTSAEYRAAGSNFPTQPDPQSEGATLPSRLRYYIDTAYSPTDPLAGGFTSGRAGFGTTTPSGWWNRSGTISGVESSLAVATVVDITTPVEMVQTRLRRFRYGAPKIRCRTGLEYVELEIGDFITISGEDTFIGFLQDGLDTSVVWEITRKELFLLDDDPGIEWELCWVRDANNDSSGFSPVDTPTVIVLPPGEADYIITTSGDIVYDDPEDDGVPNQPLVRV